jgi:hypothetical protein
MFKRFFEDGVRDSIHDDPKPCYSQKQMQQQKDRAADEMVGLCRGLLSDGAVSGQEAQFLKDWIERNAIHADDYPFNVLYRQLHAALADGVLDSDEERDLLNTLVFLVGGESVRQQGAGASLSSALPLCDPAPVIVFPQSIFVVTGTFAFGPRRSVVDAIESRGGLPGTSVTKKASYLVVGEVGSQAWRHSSYGRKIEEAVDLRESGGRIRIVSEQHWQKSLTA